MKKCLFILLLGPLAFCNVKNLPIVEEMIAEYMHKNNTPAIAVAVIKSGELIHISTDGVFSGDRFNYDETDDPDPTNLEGACKLQGEVIYGDALTIRTSFFGHTIDRNYGLVDWFLGQEKNCFGYKISDEVYVI